jgi:hypothetical protein
MPQVESNSTSVHPDAKEYSSFGADIELTSAAESAEKHAARWIRIEAVGSNATLKLKLGRDGAGVVRTFTVAAGWELVANILAIVADGTANITRATVGW